MKIYGTNDNVYDAVDAVVEYGVVAVEGTKIPAVDYANSILKCLSPYSDVKPTVGYQNVIKNGYLYYAHDLDRFPIGSPELKEIINRIDEANA